MAEDWAGVDAARWLRSLLSVFATSNNKCARLEFGAGRLATPTPSVSAP